MAPATVAALALLLAAVGSPTVEAAGSAGVDAQGVGVQAATPGEADLHQRADITIHPPDAAPAGGVALDTETLPLTGPYSVGIPLATLGSANGWARTGSGVIPEKDLVIPLETYQPFVRSGEDAAQEPLTLEVDATSGMGDVCSSGDAGSEGKLTKPRLQPKCGSTGGGRTYRCSEVIECVGLGLWSKQASAGNRAPREIRVAMPLHGDGTWDAADGQFEDRSVRLQPAGLATGPWGTGTGMQSASWTFVIETPEAAHHRIDFAWAPGLPDLHAAAEVDFTPLPAAGREIGPEAGDAGVAAAAASRQAGDSSPSLSRRLPAGMADPLAAVAGAGVFDEAAVPAVASQGSLSTIAAVPAEGLVAAALAFLGLMVLLPLLHRMRARHELLAHAMRGRAYGLANTPQGTTAGAAARALGVCRSTGFYHLEVMRKHGLLVAKPMGREIRYVASERRADPVEIRREAILARKPVQAIVAHLEAKPAATLRELARAAQLRAVSSAHMYVRDLVEVGVLEARPGRRGSVYVLAAAGGSGLGPAPVPPETVKP